MGRTGTGAGASDCARRTIKNGERPIASHVDVASSEPFDLFVNVAAQPLDERFPITILMPLCVDDLREQDGRKHPVRLKRVPHSGQKLLDFIENSILVADEGKMIAAR